MTALTLLRKLGRRVSRSQTLARWLFRVDFPPLGADQRYFDVTTPVLVRVVAPRLTADSRVLDMGTGAFACVGLALWRRCGCRVVSTDVHPDIVGQAREAVAANRAPIRVVQARFFDGLDEEFDCVTFNAPYMPTRLFGTLDCQSDGGPEGMTVIDKFLDAFGETGRVATAYLGVNALLVPRSKVVPSIRARARCVFLEEIVSGFPLPADVYVLKRRRGSDRHGSPPGVAMGGGPATSSPDSAPGDGKSPIRRKEAALR